MDQWQLSRDRCVQFAKAVSGHYPRMSTVPCVRYWIRKSEQAADPEASEAEHPQDITSGESGSPPAGQSSESSPPAALRPTSAPTLNQWSQECLWRDICQNYYTAEQRLVMGMEMVLSYSLSFQDFLQDKLTDLRRARTCITYALLKLTRFYLNMDAEEKADEGLLSLYFLCRRLLQDCKTEVDARLVEFEKKISD